MTEWTITEEERRLPILQMLALRLPAVSRVRLRRLVREGHVLVDNSPVEATYRCLVGGQVVIAADEEIASSLSPESLNVAVVFEDEHLLVVNKPAGLLCHPSATQKTGTLLNGVSHHLKATGQERIRPGLIHRLDRQTSGLIVLAKSARAHRILALQFSEHRVKKTYLGLVIGWVDPSEGRIDAPIGFQSEVFPRWGVVSAGREAQTDYRAISYWTAPPDDRAVSGPAQFTLLELTPLTGRTNQLRIHVAELGYPLVKDYVYGRADNERLFGELNAQPTTSRHLLHAAKLELTHPDSGQRLQLQSDLPTDFTAAFSGLVKTAPRTILVES